jgi:hypothetical protein
MPLKHLQHMQYVQHPPIYFCNTEMKQLQHTSKTFETLETQYKMGKVKVSRFRAPRWEPATSRSVRAPPAPAVLVGALGSVEEDLRRHGTCAPERS